MKGVIVPLSKSARKAERSSAKKREQNAKFKKQFKDTLKKATPETLSKVQAVIDKAAKKHIIHKNKAAHLKSKITKQLNTTATPSKKTSKSKTKKQ